MMRHASQKTGMSFWNSAGAPSGTPDAETVDGATLRWGKTLPLTRKPATNIVLNNTTATTNTPPIFRIDFIRVLDSPSVVQVLDRSIQLRIETLSAVLRG